MLKNINFKKYTFNNVINMLAKNIKKFKTLIKQI